MRRTILVHPCLPRPTFHPRPRFVVKIKWDTRCLRKSTFKSSRVVQGSVFSFLQHKGDIWRKKEHRLLRFCYHEILEVWSGSLGYSWVSLAVPQTSGNYTQLDGKQLVEVTEKEVASTAWLLNTPASSSCCQAWGWNSCCFSFFLSRLAYGCTDVSLGAWVTGRWDHSTDAARCLSCLCTSLELADRF